MGTEGASSSPTPPSAPRISPAGGGGGGGTGGQGGVGHSRANGASDKQALTTYADGSVEPLGGVDAAPPPRWFRSRLFWAKFLLVATGVWWGIGMQLIFYEGAGHPLALLPNLDWYKKKESTVLLSPCFDPHASR